MASCSTSEENSSQTVEEKKDFSKIEKSKVQVDELYEVQLQESTTPSTSENIKINEISLKGSAQLKRELNQVLSYHCMKHRKKFTTENECALKVNNTLKNCETKHSDLNPDFVRCIKDNLKRI